MSARIIDGKHIASEIMKEVAARIIQTHMTPGLAVILVGVDAASHLYVELKERACASVGIHFEKYLFARTETQDTVVRRIQELNARHDIHAILVQLPLPQGFDEHAITRCIDIRKDVDGFHPSNIDGLLRQEPGRPYPVLIAAILRLLEETTVALRGAHIALITKSDVFTQPLAAVLGRRGAVVEHIDSKGDLRTLTEADIVISAVGKPWFIHAQNLKAGSVAIDVGINREPQSGALRGDFHPDCAQKAGWITPVPGGVGPVTVALLLKTTIDMALRQRAAGIFV